MNGSPRMHGVDLRIVAADDAVVPITDVTLRRGYGAFDFLRVEEGVPVFVDDHLARFARSAELLRLDAGVGPDALKRHVHALIDANGGERLGLQLFLTAGDPPDGVAPGRSRLLAVAVDLPSYPRSAYVDGVALLPHRHVRELPEAKTTNYFTGLLLEARMREVGAIDVLYGDAQRVLETSRCSLFVVLEDGSLVTPGRDVLPSVTRRHVIAGLEARRSTALRDVGWDELERAREAFLASTTKGVMPVVRVGDQVVGDGRPGPVTQEAAERLRALRDAYVQRGRVGA